ncbi:hypothetical protein MTO96_036644 [Rhipicephalus appendiculatus]
MHIDPQLWATVELWNFVQAILRFQLHWPFIKAVKERHEKWSASSDYVDPPKDDSAAHVPKQPQAMED